MTDSYSTLENFDWSLRLTLSSDKISGIRKPLLLVDFLVDSPQGQKNQVVEFNPEELKSFLKTLKTIQKISHC